MSVMAAGIDGTKADIRAQPYPVSQPVIDLTCNLGHTYYDPYTQQTFDWPDQFSNVIATGGSQVDIKTFLEQSSYELELEMSVEQTETIGYIIGSFSASQSIDTTLTLFINQNMAVGIAKSTIYGVEFFLFPGSQLNISNSLKTFIDQNLTPAPVFNEQSVYAYNKMFQTYGTMFSQTSEFGGEMCMWYFSAKALFYLETTANIQVDASNNLFNIIKDAGGASGSYKSVSENWKKYTTTNMLWRGGTPPGPVVNYSAWSVSVPQNPVPLSTDLHPIYELFWFSDSLQRNTMLAWTNYMDVSFLSVELTSALNYFLQLLGAIKPVGSCSLPGTCAAYPTYPSCAYYTCPGTCPNSNTYCGANIACCVMTSTSYWNNKVSIVNSAIKNLTSQINQLQNEISQALKDPIVDHQTVVNIWNAYLPIMNAIESTPDTVSCVYSYMQNTGFGCMKWDSITPSKCTTSHTSSVAYACPYPSAYNVPLATLWYPSGIIAYASPESATEFKKLNDLGNPDDLDTLDGHSKSIFNCDNSTTRYSCYID
jgi:hypothetical protein